MNLEVTED